MRKFGRFVIFLPTEHAFYKVTGKTIQRKLAARLCKHGIHGIKLASILLKGRRMSSIMQVREFVRSVSGLPLVADELKALIDRSTTAIIPKYMKRKLTVRELARAYVRFARIVHRKNWRVKAIDIRWLCTNYLRNFADRHTSEFSAADLKCIRDQMRLQGYTRQCVSSEVVKIYRMFYWGTRNGFGCPMVFDPLTRIILRNDD